LQLYGSDQVRRFVVVREQLRETKRSPGRKLLEIPGNLPGSPEGIWHDYNQRACVEQRIEELKSDLGVDGFCLREFFATEAAFLGILMLFNLLGEFQRASGMTGYRQPASLRVQVFLCGAILGRASELSQGWSPIPWVGYNYLEFVSWT
jgi:hypothetical protein